MTTAAAIDRVVHHAILLDLTGMTSYRVEHGSAGFPQDRPPSAGENGDDL